MRLDLDGAAAKVFGLADEFEFQGKWRSGLQILDPLSRIVA